MWLLVHQTKLISVCLVTAFICISWSSRIESAVKSHVEWRDKTLSFASSVFCCFKGNKESEAGGGDTKKKKKKKNLVHTSCFTFTLGDAFTWHFHFLSLFFYVIRVNVSYLVRGNLLSSTWASQHTNTREKEWNLRTHSFCEWMCHLFYSILGESVA